MKTYKDFTVYIELLASEYDGEQDISDFVHEQSDSSEYVTYYGKAWDLVSMIRDADSSLFFDAEGTVFSSGFEFEGLDSLMGLHAYWIVSLALQTLMHDKYINKLND